MLDNLQSVNVFSPTLTETVSNILVSLICSFIVSLVYRLTYKGPGYSESFVHSIIFLSVITAFVIMVIGNNLARAFGLVGALSIIRFRTAIKDTVDIVYIFLGLAIGMAAGVGYHKLAITGTFLISGILILFSKVNYSYFFFNQYILQFTYLNEATDTETLTNIFKKYCKSYDTINIKTDINGNLEYSFYLRVSKNVDSKLIVDELQKIKGIQKINLYFDRQS